MFQLNYPRHLSNQTLLIFHEVSHSHHTSVAGDFAKNVTPQKLYSHILIAAETPQVDRNLSLGQEFRRSAAPQAVSFICGSFGKIPQYTSCLSHSGYPNYQSAPPL